MTQAAHAAFGASNSGRYLACPGSYRMTRNKPPGRSSKHAVVGAACDDVVAFGLVAAGQRHGCAAEGGLLVGLPADA